MVKNNIYYLLIAFSISLSFSVFSQEKTGKIHLKIIETSDVHGTIFPFDYINDKKLGYSLANVYSYVEKERDKPGIEVILLDNGDILQGQPIVYYSNFEDTASQHVCAAVMNYMKYDAATIGNHDIETGHNVYDKLVNQFNFPWLAANAVRKDTKQPYFKPYQIIDKQGVTIAILGLITPAIPKWLPENIWSGMEFEDMIESARKWVQIIKNDEKADIIIGLFHSGIDYTYGSQSATSYRNENASKLVAEKVPGIDIVLAGHDHSEYNENFKNIDSAMVLLLDPGSHARKVAVADIMIELDSVNQISSKIINGELINISDYEADTNFINAFKSYEFNTLNYVNRVIGKSNKTFNARESLFGDCEFTDFIHEVQFSISNADVSFTSPLNYNFEIKEGDVRVRDMFKLYRYENLLYTMELSGKEIKDYLEYSVDLWFNQMKSEKDNLLKHTFDETGRIRLTNPYYNFSSAAGIIYTVDVTKPNGKRINILRFENGDKFSLTKKYKVAINSYRGNGGGNHLIKGSGIAQEQLKNRVISSTDKDLRFYIIKYIEEKQIINPMLRNNWKIIPESWWQIAKEREYKLIFNP